jgi:hypothetical protein
MMLLPLFVLIALGCRGWITRSRWMVITFGSIPGAVLTYCFLGIGIARAIGRGRFYIVPLGGFSVGGDDAVLIGSLVFWLLAWIGILFILTLKFR